MIRYVVGFAFSPNKNEVILIKKTRPEWQNGRLNGVGGHMIDGEGVTQAMAREFEEETGVRINPELWIHKLTLVNKTIGYELNILSCFTNLVYQTKSITDEEVLLISLPFLPILLSECLIPNLRWIIPLLLDNDIAPGLIMEDIGHR